MPLKYGKVYSITTYHTDSINSLSFCDDGQYFASAGTDRRIIIFHSENGQPLQVLRSHSPVLSLAWNPSLPYELWIGCQDGSLVTGRIVGVSYNLFNQKRILT